MRVQILLSVQSQGWGNERPSSRSYNSDMPRGIRGRSVENPQGSNDYRYDPYAIRRHNTCMVAISRLSFLGRLVKWQGGSLQNSYRRFESASASGPLTQR